MLGVVLAIWASRLGWSVILCYLRLMFRPMSSLGGGFSGLSRIGKRCHAARRPRWCECLFGHGLMFACAHNENVTGTGADPIAYLSRAFGAESPARASVLLNQAFGVIVSSALGTDLALHDPGVFVYPLPWCRGRDALGRQRARGDGAESRPALWCVGVGCGARIKPCWSPSASRLRPLPLPLRWQLALACACCVAVASGATGFGGDRMSSGGYTHSGSHVVCGYQPLV